MRLPNFNSSAKTAADLIRDIASWASRAVLQYERDFNELKPATGQVTLAAGVTTTTVSSAAMTPTRKVLLTPTTANAAAALGTTYITSKAAGSFVLTHANAATTDRTFDFVITG